MTKYVGKYTENIIKKEFERYKKILEIIKGCSEIELAQGTLKYLIPLTEEEYEEENIINPQESNYQINAYQLNETCFAYTYALTLKKEEEIGYHKSTIITTTDYSPVTYKFYKAGKKIATKYSNNDNKIIDKETFTNTIPKKVFTEPNITYKETNIDRFGFLTPEKNYYAEYNNQKGKPICTLTLNSPEECLFMTKDGKIAPVYVNEWIKKFASKEDPTKIVEILGYYDTAENLKRLTKKIDSQN